MTTYRSEKTQWAPSTCLLTSYGSANPAFAGTFPHFDGKNAGRALSIALALTERAAAKVNNDLGLLAAEKAQAIIQAADEVLAGQHPDAFPLAIWQTGSGTQSNMNMNEVLPTAPASCWAGARGMERKVHPNDESTRARALTTFSRRRCTWRR